MFLFSLVLDESSDICDVVQSSIYIGESDYNSNIFEESIGHESLYVKTRGSDIFQEVRSCLESKQVISPFYASVLMEHRQ